MWVCFVCCVCVCCVGVHLVADDQPALWLRHCRNDRDRSARHLITARKGTVSGHEGGGETSKRQCHTKALPQPPRRWEHKAKAVSWPRRQWEHKVTAVSQPQRRWKDIATKVVEAHKAQAFAVSHMTALRDPAAEPLLALRRSNLRRERMAFSSERRVEQRRRGLQRLAGGRALDVTGQPSGGQNHESSQKPQRAGTCRAKSRMELRACPAHVLLLLTVPPCAAPSPLPPLLAAARSARIDLRCLLLRAPTRLLPASIDRLVSTTRPHSLFLQGSRRFDGAGALKQQPYISANVGQINIGHRHQRVRHLQQGLGASRQLIDLLAVGRLPDHAVEVDLMTTARRRRCVLATEAVGTQQAKAVSEDSREAKAVSWPRRP